jgi:hypothetical protein
MFHIYGVAIKDGIKERRYYGFEETEKDALDAVMTLSRIGSDCDYAYAKEIGQPSATIFRKRHIDHYVKID